MEIENLIGILIFLIFIVSVIRKKARTVSKDGKAGTAKSQFGWKAKLDQYLTRIKQEMEASKREGPDADTVWEELMQHEETSPESREPVIEKARSSKIEPVIRKVSAKSTVPAAFVKETPSIDLSFGIQDLRKAVVWSEILAPPIALRDN